MEINKHNIIPTFTMSFIKSMKLFMKQLYLTMNSKTKSKKTRTIVELVIKIMLNFDTMSHW